MVWAAETGPLTDGERYSFDLHGFVVRRGALTAHEVRMLRLAVVELDLSDRANRSAASASPATCAGTRRSAT